MGRRPMRFTSTTFVGRGFDSASTSGKVGDLEADLEFLMRAALKIETIREDLGKVGLVIASQVEEAMLGRRTRLDTTRAEQEAEPVRRMLEVRPRTSASNWRSSLRNCMKPSTS